MNKKSSISLAIKALEKEKKIVAFNANLYSKNIIKSYRTEKDYKQYNKLKEAIAILEKL